MRPLVTFIIFLLVACAPSFAFADPTVPPLDGTLDTDHMAALLRAHQWVPFAALVVGFLVWLQKKGKLPGLNNVPPNYRPFIALGLGILSGILNKVAVDSKSWLTAVLDGVLTGMLAIVGHDTIIEGLRGGKEIGGGGNPNPPGAGSAGMGILAGAALSAALLFGVDACGYGKTACQVIDVANQNCTWLRYLEADGTERKVQLTPEDAREFGRTVAAKQARNGDAGAEGGAK